ncbi:hypothetical protein HHI36_000868 [Cryptolaemus montrouzieri]|uniref:Uncharacterized protein n=1 Tax=Cryptolaemus montrouzieri TaxID=559131 RepID=A0ABD2P6G4_9CUCU
MKEQCSLVLHSNQASLRDIPRIFANICNWSISFLSRISLDSPLGRSGIDNTHSSTPSGSPALKPKLSTPGAVTGLDLLPAGSNDEVTNRREVALRQHSFFQLKVHLRRGQRLTAMDKNVRQISGRVCYCKDSVNNIDKDTETDAAQFLCIAKDGPSGLGDENVFKL